MVMEVRLKVRCMDWGGQRKIEGQREGAQVKSTEI